MEAMNASGRRLCQEILDAVLRPGTKQCLQTVLASASVIALGDDGFASHMGKIMVHSIRKFTTVNKCVDELAVFLEPAHPGSSLPATLIGLDGENLFHTLLALQLPDIMAKNVHLEAALATLRLAEQEIVNHHIKVYEEIVYIGHCMAKDDVMTLAVLDRPEALDTIVHKHVDLAMKVAAPQLAHSVEEEEDVDACIFLLASPSHH